MLHGDGHLPQGDNLNKGATSFIGGKFCSGRGKVTSGRKPTSYSDAKAPQQMLRLQKFLGSDQPEAHRCHGESLWRRGCVRASTALLLGSVLFE